MKVKANQLHEFVKKSSFNGLIPGSVYKLTTQGLENFNKTLDTMALVHGILKSHAVKGDVGFTFSIGSNERLLKCLKEFGDEDIELVVNEQAGRLHILGKSLQVECVMTSPNMIDSTLEEMPATLHWEAEPFKMDSGLFKKAANYAKILGQNSLKIKVENGELMIVSGEENFDQFTQKTKVSAQDFQAEYGEALHNIVEVLEGDLLCWAKNDFPLKFEEENPTIKMTAICAPVVAKE